MAFDYSVLVDYAPYFINGFLLTVEVTICSAILALICGVGIALMKISRSWPLRWVAIGYIEFFRNMPFLVLLFLLYYMLPFYGIRFPAFMLGVLSVGLYTSAYFAEIIRGGILSLPRGQMASALACGMTRTQAMRHVIFPQIIGIVVPPLTSQTMSMVKETALLSSITMNELTMAGLRVQGITFSPLEAFAGVAVLYWLLTAAISALAFWLEHVLQPHSHLPRHNTSTVGRW